MLKPGTENNVWSHWNGYQAELRSANEIANTADQQVLKYGDKIGLHGADIISVDVKTGDVSFWDSKYRSNPAGIKNSPTFSGSTTRENALEEAKIVIMNSELPDAIKYIALDNMNKKNFSANTLGHGAAKNSTTIKYCNGKEC